METNAAIICSIGLKPDSGKWEKCHESWKVTKELLQDTEKNQWPLLFSGKTVAYYNMQDKKRT